MLKGFTLRAKLQAILQAPAPRNVQELRSFLAGDYLAYGIGGCYLSYPFLMEVSFL